MYLNILLSRCALFPITDSAWMVPLFPSIYPAIYRCLRFLCILWKEYDASPMSGCILSPNHSIPSCKKDSSHTIDWLRCRPDRRVCSALPWTSCCQWTRTNPWIRRSLFWKYNASWFHKSLKNKILSTLFCECPPSREKYPPSREKCPPSKKFVPLVNFSFCEIHQKIHS